MFSGALLEFAHRPVFNFYDFLLLASALQCLLFAVFFLLFNKRRGLQALFSAFMLAIGLGQFNFFITYHIPTHTLVQQHFSLHFFCFSTIFFFAQGPLLLEYIRALTYGKFRFSLHFIAPLVVYFLLILWSPVATNGGVLESIFWRDYVLIGTVGFFVSAVYGGYTVFHLCRYSKALEKQIANFETLNLVWLRVITISFLVVWVMQVLPPFFYNRVHWVVQQFTTHAKDIILLGLVCYVVFSSLIYGFSVRRIPTPKEDDESSKACANDLAAEHSKEEIETINKAMSEAQLYHRPNLTVEALADYVNLSVKDLSFILNHHFGQNFYEFVNQFRIEEAKRLLISAECSNKPIQLIYEEVGFRSKSSFNTLFKKSVGLTPSRFRQQNASLNDSKEIETSTPVVSR